MQVSNRKRKMMARARQVLRGKALLTFRKLDGNVRVLLGTTNLALIPKRQHPRGLRSPNGTITAFDLKKMEWRSLRPKTIMSVVNVKKDQVDL